VVKEIVTMGIVTDVLRKASAKKSTKPSTDMVELTVTSGTLAKHKQKYDAAKVAKAELELSEEELLGEVVPSYIEKIKEEYVSSARIHEGDIEATISWKDAYSKIPVEKAEEIKDLVGSRFDDYFKEVNEIVVKEEVAANPELLEELINAVGPDTFSKYFDVAQHLRPTTRFTEERHRTLSPSVNDQLNETVRQYKPSVRVVVK